LICLADAKGIEPPDLLELQTTAETHKQELGEVQTQLGRYQERLRHLLQHRSALDELVQERHAQQEHLQVLQRLSGIANGYLMDGSRGITFSRWVLGAMLDDVLAHASIRLSTMSSNRFAFKRRVDVARGTRAGQGGLDLDVIDSFSGKVRAANTLSGGEGFLAALALALGLADVVQGERGGVHIEAMFVDEGFGSLDPGALDLAIQTLLNLRKGGRMVGIISHVPELISRLDARLKVTATQDGSLTQWVLP